MLQRLKALLKKPYLIVLLVPFILMAPVLLTGRAMFWGTPGLQFTPWWAQAWQTLLSGQLPLWNPLSGMGAPLLANYQSALLYPPTWLYFGFAAIAGIPGIAWAQALLVALHLAFAGYGMVKLTRRLDWATLAQTVAGLAFGLSGYLVSRSHFLSINAAAAWLPWILLAGYNLVQTEKPHRSLLALAFTAGMQLLSGHAQTTWYSLLLAGVWIGFWGWQKNGWRSLRDSWLRYALAGLWAAALAAAQLIPTTEYLLQSQRAQTVDFEFAMTYSFWPWRLLTLFVPDLFGNPTHGDYWGYATYWEDAAYLGLLGILLALAYIFRCGKSPQNKRLARLLLVIILVSILFSLGDNTPVFPWLYRHVPTFNMFQAPTRWMIWAQFALAMLAGLGVMGWQRPEGRSLYWSRLATAGAFAVTLGVGLGWYLLTQSDLSFGNLKLTFVPAFALAGLWGLGAGALNLLAPPRENPQPKPWWQWAVAAWLALDLLVAGWGLNPGAPLDVYRSSHTEPSQGRTYFPTDDLHNLMYARFLRFDTFEIDEPWSNIHAIGIPNINLLDGTASANNFDPLVPGRYAAWMNTLDSAPPDAQTAMLARMNVTEVITVDEASPYTESHTPFPDSLPRVRWAPCTLAANNGDTALTMIISGEHDPQEFVILEGIGQSICAEDANPTLITPHYTPNRIQITTQTDAPGYLVLADTYYPGWRATVDGQPAEILQADYLFRAVYLPAGSNTVTFSYQPLSFYAGAALSLFAWAALVILWRRWDA